MTSSTLLDNLKNENVYHSPYPYIFRPKALEDNYCNLLLREFPSLEKVAKDKLGFNNFRFNFGSKDVLESNEISPSWVNFIRNHASQHFFDQFVDAFADNLTTKYSHVAKSVADWKKLRVGIRKLDSFSTHDVLVDVQIAGNTPVTQKTSVRGRHIDDPRKLYGALYYLRLDEDNSTGGDLEISGPLTDNFKFYNTVYVKDRYAKVYTIVPYQKNNFVMFLNSPVSWHGVTPREVTKSPRLFVNFIAEMKEPLFDISDKQDKWDLLFRKLRLRRYSKYEF